MMKSQLNLTKALTLIYMTAYDFTFPAEISVAVTYPLFISDYTYTQYSDIRSVKRKRNSPLLVLSESSDISAT